MLCEECGVEMRIVKAAARARQEESGKLVVEHVSDVRCCNARCGQKGKAHEVVHTVSEE